MTGIYLVFAYDYLDHGGGMRDFAGMSDCIIEACSIAMQAFPKFHQGTTHIHDLVTNREVFESAWEGGADHPKVYLDDMDEEDATMFRIKFGGQFTEKWNRIGL